MDLFHTTATLDLVCHIQVVVDLAPLGNESPGDVDVTGTPLGMRRRKNLAHLARRLEKNVLLTIGSGGGVDIAVPTIITGVLEVAFIAVEDAHIPFRSELGNVGKALAVAGLVVEQGRPPIKLNCSHSLLSPVQDGLAILGTQSVARVRIPAEGSEEAMGKIEGCGQLHVAVVLTIHVKEQMNLLEIFRSNGKLAQDAHVERNTLHDQIDFERQLGKQSLPVGVGLLSRLGLNAGRLAVRVGLAPKAEKRLRVLKFSKARPIGQRRRLLLHVGGHVCDLLSARQPNFARRLLFGDLCLVEYG